MLVLSLLLLVMLRETVLPNKMRTSLYQVIETATDQTAWLLSQYPNPVISFLATWYVRVLTE